MCEVGITPNYIKRVSVLLLVLTINIPQPKKIIYTLYISAQTVELKLRMKSKTFKYTCSFKKRNKSNRFVTDSPPKMLTAKLRS